MYAHTCPRTGTCTVGDGNKNLMCYMFSKQVHAKLEIFLLKSVGTLKFNESVNLYRLE